MVLNKIWEKHLENQQNYLKGLNNINERKQVKIEKNNKNDSNKLFSNK